jgi:flavin reductase (DIM6/NTAB) family NADH-FMN oxidoreductase RutF
MTAASSPDPREYRNVIGRFATGVTVVTWDDGEHRRGMTANAVTSLSLDPLLVLVCVDRKVSAHPQLESAHAFAVNILAADQIPVSMAFAQHGLEDMADIPYHLGGTGSPLIDGALAWLDCAITDRLPGGDHTIMVGRVVDLALARPEAEPLLFYGGHYVSLGTQLP